MKVELEIIYGNPERDTWTAYHSARELLIPTSTRTRKGNVPFRPLS